MLFRNWLRYYISFLEATKKLHHASTDCTVRAAVSKTLKYVPDCAGAGGRGVSHKKPKRRRINSSGDEDVSSDHAGAGDKDVPCRASLSASESVTMMMMMMSTNIF